MWQLFMLFVLPKKNNRHMALIDALRGARETIVKRLKYMFFLLKENNRDVASINSYCKGKTIVM